MYPVHSSIIVCVCVCLYVVWPFGGAYRAIRIDIIRERVRGVSGVFFCAHTCTSCGVCVADVRFLVTDCNVCGLFRFIEHTRIAGRYVVYIVWPFRVLVIVRMAFKVRGYIYILYPCWRTAFRDVSTNEFGEYARGDIYWFLFL